MTKGATCGAIFLLWSFVGRFQVAVAFTFSQPGQTKTRFRQSALHLSSSPDTHPSSQKKEDSTLEENEQASKWRAEAERIRLEAEKMDVSLTLNKIESIERKLGKKVWLEKNPAEQADLETKLEALQRKLAGDNTVIMPPKKDIPSSVPVETALRVTGTEARKSSSGAVSTSALSEVRSAEKVKHGKSSDPSDNPLSGFDEEDLALYLPAAEEIEARMTNATLSEKLETFQTAPELQEHMKAKIQTMLVQPMEDMQRLEDMKQKYLYSSSSM
jgi:flagellar biosynthesis component FlhA